MDGLEKVGRRRENHICYMGRDLGAIDKERLVRLVMLLVGLGMGLHLAWVAKVENIHAWRQNDCRYVNSCIH